MTQAEPPSPDPTPRDAVKRAFGSENRRRLLGRYFDQAGLITPTNAWQHVYRLLLWIDRTTALAHCYESDKAQPGRGWYERSLIFHDWVSRALDVPPADLAEHVDWLFREAIRDLASTAAADRSAAYERQREPYAGRGLPEPGDDPELAAILTETLSPWWRETPPQEVLRELTRRIHSHLTQENKRKNLVGEGFEDVLAAVLLRLPTPTPLEVHTRILLHQLPGFHPGPPTEKPKRVDLAVLAGGRRILVTAKWSIRADREEQFDSDFQVYARLEAAGQDFDYTLITNEFDAARLRAACERRRQNALLFRHVVHINPEGVLAVYGQGSTATATALREHVASGRLMSLQAWLEQFSP